MTDQPKQQLRKAFIQTMTELAQKDKKVLLIVGDVGFSFMEPFKERFPKQFLNIGVLEQSMMTVAAGMAAEGFKPYVYTMMNFVLLRPLEQVRNDLGFAKANVKLFAVKGSEAYRFLGYSHNMFGTEEDDITKNLPNFNVYRSESEDGVRTAMLFEYERNGPAYFRI